MPHEQSFLSSVLSVWEDQLTVMRLFLSLVHPLLRASGKDKTMKRIPKTPVEFDYDLWTTEDGKCMVRVKATGETTEVDREVMKMLRNEEKKLRRSYDSRWIVCQRRRRRNTTLPLYCRWTLCRRMM